MKIQIYILIIILAFILCLIHGNKNKKNEIEELHDKLKSVETKFKDETVKLNKSISDYNVMYQKYVHLMRTYMIARQKSEIEIIDEIEQSISHDYEELGSTSILATEYIASAMADFYTSQIKETEQKLKWMGQQYRSNKAADIRKNAAILIMRAKKCQYAMEAALVKIMAEHPDISYEYIERHYGISLAAADLETPYNEEEISNYKQQISVLKAKCRELEEKIQSFESFKDIRWPLLRDSVLEYKKEFASNLTAIPYMSRIIADIMTLDLDRLAWSLSWGNNYERKKKVTSLTALKKEKAEEIERIKGAEYQLAYLLELYPVLQDVIDADFKELNISYENLSDYDPVRKYIDRKSWEELSPPERNQLALDRYIESRQKSKWQIGRDYELYCGYCYEQKGYTVDYFGSYKGLEDLGRDLIVKQGSDIRIVQCKYWSRAKQIHENHIMQLYGSVIEYNLENGQEASAILITNTTLSVKAKEFAHRLRITYKENFSIGAFPRIKCNIGIGEFGEPTKIYHLPFDQQYDVTKVDGKGEFMAMTVAEAERAGFRRAYKWHENR